MVRKYVWSAIGFAGFAFGLTLFSQGMRAVMDVGGACASGGPYVSAQPCPPGTAYAIVGLLVCGVGAVLIVAAALPRGPRLGALTWSALFLALGWNFLDYGAFRENDRGSTTGLIVCAVVFGLLGVAPLLGAVRRPRRTFWGLDVDPPSSGFPFAGMRPPGWPGGGPVRVVVPGAAMWPGHPPAADAPFVPPTPETDPADDLVADLERLSAMHRDGALTDAEFARAKERLFGGDGR